MSANARAEILVELGRGDEVAVAERLKAAALALTAAIDGLDDAVPAAGDRHAQVLDATSEPAEALLAVVFPALEYGHGASLDALPRALRQVALATSAGRVDQAASRVAATATLGRVVWAIAAYALHCNRPEALAAAARAQIVVPFTNDDVEPVVSLRSLRFPDAFGQDAGNSFRDYHDWLRSLTCVADYPLFAAELEVALDEGDLVLAMLLGRVRSRVYAHGRSRSTVRRLAARLSDRAQREGFETLFPGAGTLEERLDAAYRATEGDRGRFDSAPESLFEVEQ